MMFFDVQLLLQALECLVQMFKLQFKNEFLNVKSVEGGIVQNARAL
jgi:hypothetical protein